MPNTEHVAAQIEGIFRYPVKGLSPQQLPQAELHVGRTLAFDRAFAIENGSGRFDPQDPQHLSKVNFLMLMRHERMAALRTSFDDDSQNLEIHLDGALVAQGRLDTQQGIEAIERFISGYMADELRGAPKIVSARDHSFSDVSAKCLHLINLASVRELERLAGYSIEPLRFRANLVIDGPAPFSELEWIGNSFEVGAARLKAFKRTERCAATNVDPQTAHRQGDLPGLLKQHLGHADFGIYLMVDKSGLIGEGDTLKAV